MNLYELYVGPDSTGRLDPQKVKSVLQKHSLSFSFKEQVWMQWGEEPELGLLFQIEGNQKEIEETITELREVLDTEYISTYCPGDLST